LTLIQFDLIPIDIGGEMARIPERAPN